MARDTWIERVVFEGPSRVIDVGVTRRLFEGATRRAVELRDRECFNEYCDLTAADCDVDHIQPWTEGRAHRPGQRPPSVRFP